MFSGELTQRQRAMIVAIVYSVLTIVLTFPLSFHLNDHLVGRGTADVWQFPWNNFIFKERILSGRDPYFTDRIFYPVGTSLLLHTNTEFNSVVGFVLSPFLNEIGQMNVGLLLSSFLSALGTYLLTMRLTGSFAGALFAGIAFAFCPFRITRYFGHINFSITQMIPFALWAFMRMAESRRLLWSVVTGIFFALAYYSNQYYMMYLIISFAFMTVYGLWRIPSWRTRQFFKNLCISGLVAVLLLSQVAWHFVQDKRDKVIAQHQAGGGLAAKGSAYLSDYFIAGPMGGLAREIYGLKYNGPHYKVTTGFVTLTLAIAGLIFAIRRKNQPVLVFGFLGILFLLITLGPFLKLGDFRLPLPYAVLMKIPYMNHVRLPYRAAPMVALLFAVLAGYGVALLLRSKLRWRTGIAALLFSALVFEIWQAPLKLSRFAVPEVYHTIRNMEHGSMLTLPFENNVANAAHQMKYQIIHHKDLLNGRTARASPLRAQEAYLRNIPIAQSFEAATRTRGKRGILHHLESDKESAADFRRFFNVRYLAIHDRFAESEEVRQYVDAVFPDARLMYDKQRARVYELPRLPEPEKIQPDGKSLRLFLFSGWKPKASGTAVCFQNEAKLLVPDVDPNQTLLIEMQLRSRDPLALQNGRVVFKLKNETVADLKLNRRFEPAQLSIPGKRVLEGRRILKVELVDGAGEPLQFKEADTPKLELELKGFQKK